MENVIGGKIQTGFGASNADTSLRGQVVQSQSADALQKTIAQDQNGDGDTDLTVVDATVVNADRSRVQTVTQTNTDGSVRGMQKETLAADKVSSELWVDQNQNGVFEATDLVTSVVVTAGTLARTETVWSRNADGSVKAQQTAVTNAAGSTTTTTQDADGDADSRAENAGQQQVSLIF